MTGRDRAQVNAVWCAQKGSSRRTNPRKVGTRGSAPADILGSKGETCFVIWLASHFVLIPTHSVQSISIRVGKPIP